LSHLDLTGNGLNGDPAFFSLSTIPALQTLIMNENSIFHVPKFQYGFEALSHLSLNGNKIETVDDIVSLTDLEQLEHVAIVANPIVLRLQQLKMARTAFASANIDLQCEEIVKPLRSAIVEPLHTVKFDPLALPAFTRAHVRALNRRVLSPVDESFEFPPTPPPPVVTRSSGDGFFMTSFSATLGEEAVSVIEPPQLPVSEEPPVTSVWGEIPVLQPERQVKFRPRHRPQFVSALHELEFLTTHPEIPVRPREPAPVALEDEEAADEAAPGPFPGREVRQPTLRSAIATKLAARMEYTKAEVRAMLGSMEGRLADVEQDLSAADKAGQGAIGVALDQDNFASLHKQYEAIRAELIDTLNS
jgi:hypothetical protein